MAPQEDCTARVSAGQVLRVRVMARSSFCCFSSEGTAAVVDAMFVQLCNCLIAANILTQITVDVGGCCCLPRYDANSKILNK